MNEKLESKLYEKYPKIFMSDSDISFWGIECDDGWYDLIDELCAIIQNWNNNKSEIDQITVIQIKEKFGTLRFYYDGGDNFIDGSVSFAERISSKICETCGNSGKLRHDSWMVTLCDNHYDERQKRKRKQMEDYE